MLERTPPTGWEDRWARRCGLSRAALGDRIAPIVARGAIGAATLAATERELGDALGLDAVALRELMDDIWVEYLGTLDVELTAFFAGLRPRHRTGILSNSLAGAREREAAAYGFPDLCDALVYSHETGIAKPDPAAYALVCDRLGVAPDRTVFLDDVAENVDAAAATGMIALQHSDTPRAIAEVTAALDRLG